MQLIMITQFVLKKQKKKPVWIRAGLQRAFIPDTPVWTSLRR